MIDVWAMGVTLYALANLSHPFKNIKSIKEGIHKPSNHSNEFINEIIELCLTYDFTKRPTAKQLYDKVINYIGSKPSSTIEYD